MAAGRRQERSPGRRGVRLVQASRAAATAAAGVLPCAAALVLAALIVPEREAAAGGSPEELDGPQALMKPRADGGEPGEPERGGENRAAPPRGAENDRAAPPRGPGDDRAAPPRGAARAETARPKNFPHRIWAACDFEARLPDYGWFGPPEKKNIPAYPGNATALGVGEKPYGNFSALMTGINPVPGPRLGKVNQLYLRYHLRGGDTATFQHFSLTTEDNNHVVVSGLTQDRWSEVTINFTRDARRNDGTPGVPFQEGERMDDFKVFVGKPGDGRNHELFIDDVIFFADDPGAPPDPEPFPNRVILLAAFDTGTGAAERKKYWPGEMEIVTSALPEGAWWGAARAVPRKDGKGKWIQLRIDPPRPVGARTRLRFRYHLTGAASLTAQIFDLTDGDNRHVRLNDLKEKTWTTTHVDFARDGRRNDGSNTPFAAGHVVDDLFFFVEPASAGEVDFLVDEVVLYDGGERLPAGAPADSGRR